MKIIMLCHNTFLMNNSGINTFITHMENMCNELKVDYEIITENYEKIKHNNVYYVSSLNNCIEDLYKKYDKNNNIYIADSLFTLPLLDLLSKTLKGKFIYYTHIGDLLHNDESNFDFSQKDKELTIRILENNTKIIIGTQSEQLRNFLSNTFSKNKVEWLPEPLYLNNDIYDLKVYDVSCVMNNSKRKKIPEVINLCNKLNLSLNLITSDIIRYWNIVELIKNKKINVLEEVPNDNIPSCISLSKILIYFSDIEVFPYGILESASIIPVIINNNALWGKLFPDEFVYKVDYNNFEECKKIINNLLENPIPKMDLKQYQQKTINIWKKFMDGENELQ